MRAVVTIFNDWKRSRCDLERVNGGLKRVMVDFGWKVRKKKKKRKTREISQGRFSIRHPRSGSNAHRTRPPTS
jgi:hypothetical protein